MMKTLRYPPKIGPPLGQTKSNPSFLKADGMQIDVEHLCYSVNIGNDPTKMKNILKDINFRVRPGSFCAIMGPSGSGKSTLLDLLADRKTYGLWSGEIYFNHGPRSKYFNRDSAYILQDDLFYATLTVRETLYFSAGFHLPEGTTEKDINARVDELLEMMGLTPIEDYQVGDETHKGISGGQRKRLSIAAEIVASPNLIFLDEPTSGLDSNMALEVISTVRKLADQNRTCLATIHQPSPEVFALFDKLVLLCDGKMVYYGAADQVVDYFSSVPLNYYFDESHNPAEFILDITERIIHPLDREEAYHTEELVELYLKSKYHYVALSKNALDAAEKKASQDDLSQGKMLLDQIFTRKHATRKITQFNLITRRNVIAIVRDIPEITAQLLKNVLVGALVGTIFYQQAVVTTPLFDENGLPTPQVQNISSLLFFGTMFNMISNIQAIPYLCSRNFIYRRELASYCYSVSPYWLSHIITVVPLQVIGYTTYVLITYFLCHFPYKASYFFYFYFLGCFSTMSSYYFAMLLAAYLQSAHLTLIFFPLTFLFLSTFAGFAIPVSDIPPFWVWAPYVDFVRWSFEGLMTNQWESYDDDNNSSETVLEMYGMSGFNKYNSFWIAALATGLFIIGVFFAMKPPRKTIVKLSLEEILLRSSRDTASTGSGSPPAISPDEQETKNRLHEKLLPDDKDYEAAERGGKTLGEGEAPKTRKTEDGKENHDRENQRSLELVREFSQKNKDARRRSVRFGVDSSGVTPSYGYYLTFRDISYTVDVKNPQTGSIKPLKIISGLSGRVVPKQMCAVMGPSGAGKSTLLDVLADRKTLGVITGEVFINGQPRTKAMMKSTAYVMQENAHIGALTVQETLHFAAQLRLPQDMADEQKDERVSNIARILGLTDILESVVGSEGKRGISGGQKKRLSIGVEIIHLPEMIFLDEPTSGLDSAIAYEVMFTVRQLANQHRTVLCTIHQPSTHTFELFDTAMILVKGRMFFFGEREKMIAFFTDSLYHFPYETGNNAADYVINIGAQAILSDHNEKVAPEKLAELYEKSELYAEFTGKIDEYLTHDRKIPISATTKRNSQGEEEDANKKKPRASLFEASTQYFNTSKISFNITRKSDDHAAKEDQEEEEEYEQPTSQLFQIKTLVLRLLLCKWRDFNTTCLITLRYILVAFFYGSIFFQLHSGTDPTDYTNRLSIMYFCLIATFMSHQEDIPLLHEDRVIFYRERDSNIITPKTYWISRLLVTLPFDLVNIFFFCLIIYYMAGLRTNDSCAFGFFLAVVWLSNFISMFVCSFIAFVSSTTEIAMSIFPTILFFTTAFQGFIIYIPEFPTWLGWAANLSYMRFAFQALVLNEFQGNGDLPLGDDYINMLGFDTISKTECACLLIVFLFIHGAVSVAAVIKVNHEKR